MALKVNLATDDGGTAPDAYVRVEPRALSKARGLMTFAIVAYRRNPTVGTATLAALPVPVIPAPLAPDTDAAAIAAHGAAVSAYETAHGAYLAAQDAADADLELQPFLVRDCACTYAVAGANPWVQAYDHLKTLPGFAAAADA